MEKIKEFEAYTASGIRVSVYAKKDVDMVLEGLKCVHEVKCEELREALEKLLVLHKPLIYPNGLEKTTIMIIEQALNKDA